MDYRETQTITTTTFKHLGSSSLFVDLTERMVVNGSDSVRHT